MPKKDDIHLDRLTWAMQRARLALRYPREERTRAVRQMVGSHWSEEGAKEKVPINLLSLYCKIVGRSLIAKAPRVMLSTFLRPHKPVVEAMQTWANKEIEASHLDATLKRVVLDGLFSIGITKVALAAPVDAARMAWNLGAGKPFAERVDLDDFVFDVHARSFEEVGFIGHRIRVPYDAIRDSKLYNRGRKDLTPSTDQPFNQEGDERISMLGRTYYSTDDQEFEDYVDLWEVYLPRHRLIYTFAESQLSGANPVPGKNGDPEPLRQQRWIGPDCGPYHVLGYQTVPGNIMPKGPIQDLVDLHEFVNQTYRKIMRQAARFKKQTFYRRNADNDAARIQQGNDGDLVPVDNPDMIKEVAMGGVDPMLMQTFIDALQRFSYMAGNLDMMGGLSPQAKTLGQDKMLEENASASVADMQDMTTIYTSGVLKALCWYWHHDPFNVMKAQHVVPGMPELSQPQQVLPQHRQRVPFEDMDIRVDPYSMQQTTPKQRQAQLDQVMQTILIPMAQQLQAQGIFTDMNAYLQKRAKNMDMPDLVDLITIREPPPPTSGEGGAGGGAPGTPQETTRNYNRISQPGRTQKGDDQNKMNALMGINPGGAPETANANGAMK